jgi:hypothetical protein
MPVAGRRPFWVYLLATLILAWCLVLGWSGFDPYVPQEAVRDTIRGMPRGVVQLVVQYIVPALLLGFLVNEAVAALRSRRG